MPPEAKPTVVEDPLDEHIEVPEDDTAPLVATDIDPDAADADADAFKKLDNKAWAKMRKDAADSKKEADALRKKVADFEKRPAPIAAPTPVGDPNRRREMIGGVAVPETKAEWDALARADWQTAVDMRSIINARKVAEEVRTVEKTTRSLNEAKDKVLQRHPELADKTTEKGQIYMKILENNPEYLTMSKGPILAMRDMEDEMEAQGYTKDEIYDAKKVVTQNESTRVARGSLTGGGKMPEKSARTVTLSKDDMEFCKTQGIDPAEYAKEKLNLEQNRKGASL